MSLIKKTDLLIQATPCSSIFICPSFSSFTLISKEGFASYSKVNTSMSTLNSLSSLPSPGPGPHHGIHSFNIHTCSSLVPYFLLLNLFRSFHRKHIEFSMLLFLVTQISFLFIMCSSFHMFTSLNFMHCGFCPHTSIETPLLKITHVCIKLNGLSSLFLPLLKIHMFSFP